MTPAPDMYAVIIEKLRKRQRLIEAEMIRAAGMHFTMEFDLATAVSLVASLKLALRQGSEGHAAETARNFIAAIHEQVEESGYHYVAELIKPPDEIEAGEDGAKSDGEERA